MSSHMACNAGGLLGLRDLLRLSRVFLGISGKNSETEPVPQKDLQPFHTEACLQTARREAHLKAGKEL